MSFKPGLHKVQCDRCGGIYYSNQVTFDGYSEGLVVCRGPGTRNCYDPKHPQDYVRARPEDIAVPNARPFNWVSIDDVYPNGVTPDDL